MNSTTTNKITLFKGTISECTYNLDEDLQLVDYDEQDGDILATFDLSGVTLEYISTSEGLTLDCAYVWDGGYITLDINIFNIKELKVKVGNMILDHVMGI